MVKKTKLLLPLLLSLTSIFCVGYAGWAFTIDSSISTTISAKVGDVISPSDYIKFDTSVSNATNGIEPLNYVLDDTASGFTNEGLIGNAGLMRLYFSINVGKYFSDFKISSSFDLSISILLGENSYLNSTYIDSAILSLNTNSNKTRYILEEGFSGGVPTRPSFVSITLNSTFNQFSGVLSFSDLSSYFESYTNLELKVCFDLLFNFNSTNITTILNDISSFTFDIGVNF